MIWVYCCDVNKCWLIDWYSCWETATFACGVRSARERSFEEASGETEVGRRPLTPEPRPLPPWTRPRHANRTPTWSSDLWGRYFAWNWTIPVVLLATVVATTATYVVVKLVQECKFFLRILLPFYGNSSPQTIHFLGKRTVTSKRSW